MLTTLNGMFSRPKPHRINFIKENKKKIKESMVHQNNMKSRIDHQNNMKSRIDITKTRGSQTEVTRSTSESSAAIKENKRASSSSCRLSGKRSMAVFLHEKRERGNISSLSLSAKQSSSQRISNLKNQSCQTIDPRRCDQLYHDGVIKYPSNKILQELAEIEKQKANRLDAHVKKEYFRRNKIRQKNSKKLMASLKSTYKGTGKGDEIEEMPSSTSEEEKYEEKEGEQEREKEPTPEPVFAQREVKPSPPVMRAAEIIRKTTEDINYSTRSHIHSDYNTNSKGDAKPFKKMSKKLSHEEEILKTVLDPQCPPGHIPLPDTERKKTLHMLRVSHAELVREMNLLPVRTDTLRVRQKKIHLENQLNKIEEGIKVFNKSKVYVKIEE